MTENNNNTNEDIIEVPITEQGETSEQENAEDMLDLQDVGYMVIVGRKKDGDTFFRTVGVNDLIMIDGLVNYAKLKVQDTISKSFDLENK